MYKQYRNISMAKQPLMVSTKWLVDKIASKAENLRIIDGSWHLPFTKRNAGDEYLKKHIPGAQFFDIDECCSKSPELDHMLPTNEQFQQYVGSRGVGNDTHVVIYDNNENFGMLSAQRVWWTFKVFGHDQVSILDGGFPKWQRDGYEVTDEVSKVDPQSFKVTEFHKHLVKSFDDMVKNLDEGSFAVIDARPAGRYEGTAPEPRPGIEPGHMPNSMNIPFPTLLNPETKTFKSPEELMAVFSNKGVDLSKPLTVSCGSGVSACMLVLAAYLCGKEDVAVYDGAWTEWFQKAKKEHILTSK